MTLLLPAWHKPSFEELSMNAEIGAYQAEEGEGERHDVPFFESSRVVAVSAPPAPRSENA